MAGRSQRLAYPSSHAGEDLRNHRLRRRGRCGRPRRLGDRADPPRGEPALLRAGSGGGDRSRLPPPLRGRRRLRQPDPGRGRRRGRERRPDAGPAQRRGGTVAVRGDRPPHRGQGGQGDPPLQRRGPAGGGGLSHRLPPLRLASRLAPRRHRPGLRLEPPARSPLRGPDDRRRRPAAGERRRGDRGDPPVRRRRRQRRRGRAGPQGRGAARAPSSRPRARPARRPHEGKHRGRGEVRSLWGPLRPGDADPGAGRARRPPGRRRARTRTSATGWRCSIATSSAARRRSTVPSGSRSGWGGPST